MRSASESLFPSTSALRVGVTAASPVSKPLCRAGREEFSGDWTTPHVGEGEEGGGAPSSTRWFGLYGTLADMPREFLKYTRTVRPLLTQAVVNGKCETLQESERSV